MTIECNVSEANGNASGPIAKFSGKVFGTFSRPAKLAYGDPAPWSAVMLNPEEKTCSVLVY